MPRIELRDVAVPMTVDASDADDFVRAIELGNAVQAVSYGTDELAYEPAEELPWFHDPHRPHRMLVASLDGTLAGRATYETTTGDDADSAWILVEVLPRFRGRGVGTALADAVETLAIAQGKAKALAFTAILDEPGERIAPPTGFGSVPLASREARFLRARGYALEQVERVSRLPLPVPGLEALLAEAVASSGPDYVLHTWIGSTPERWRADLALLATRMSTDAPSAGLEEPEDLWTVERVADEDARNATMNPRDQLTAAVEHVPSGRLVGFSVLSVPTQARRAVAQEATLVLREHRGHRLGMLLKLANLAHPETVAPGHPSVTTFNAEENRPMLDVNEAVGFVPIAFESAWRKDL